MTRSLSGPQLLRALACCGLGTLAACRSAETSRNDQLRKVAKDWAMTIRASQVIPVYPLTEDLMPGDVFLVQKSSQRQAEQYEEDGFLPLDLHVARLTGLDYAALYEGTFGVDRDHPAPTVWQTSPEKAPRSAFPSYAFDVQLGGNLSAAIPIQGIPLGLQLIQASSATGNVTIADSSTYGLSFEQVYRVLRDWTDSPVVTSLLDNVHQANTEQLYLRVVSRVYLAKRVITTMANTAEMAGGVAAGGMPQLAVPTDTELATVRTTLDQLLKGTGEQAGGSIELRWATKRSVSLSETFARPLVIGYLGFDFPILEGGALGTPVATLSSLEGDATPSVGTLAFDDYLETRTLIEHLEPRLRDRIYTAAAAALALAPEARAFSDKFDRAQGTVSQRFSRATIAWAMARGLPPSSRPQEVDAALRAALRVALATAQPATDSEGETEAAATDAAPREGVR